MTDSIPQWAWDKADEDFAKHGHRYAFAALIFKHEEPPVDPLEAEAELLYQTWVYSDDSAKMAINRALRRGIELGKQL